MDYFVTSDRRGAEHCRRRSQQSRTTYRILTTVDELEALTLGVGDWLRYSVPVSDELIEAAQAAVARRENNCGRS